MTAQVHQPSVILVADRLRRRFWQLVLRLQIGRQLIANRNQRLALIAGCQMVLVLALCVALPAWMLLLGPIILGVPHVIADIRLLVIRPLKPVERFAKWAIVMPLAGVSLLSLIALCGGPLSVTGEVFFGSLALVMAVVVARGSLRLRFSMLAAAVVALMVGVVWPGYAMLVLVHLHNVVAVAMWVAWSKKSGYSLPSLFVGLLFIGFGGLIVAGVFDSITLALLTYGTNTGLDLDALAAMLAPGLAPHHAMRVLVLFAFAQAVHYTVWLRLIPGSEPFEPRRGPTTFSRNWGRLAADFGKHGARIAVALCLLPPLFALVSAEKTREIYFSVVVFHGWLELAMAGHFIASKKC